MNIAVADYILRHIEGHPKDIATFTASELRLSRQTIVKYLTQLIADGKVTASGKTKGRTYALRDLVKKKYIKPVIPGMAEDLIWRTDILPYMHDVPDNVKRICEHGFTEIVNNVLDHSNSPDILYTITRNATCIEMDVMDHGVGIFNKIQAHFGLSEPRDALLQLSKGKLTTAEIGHTGEGIYFSSRMFDYFAILSHPLYYGRSSTEDSGWLLEVKDSDQKGTLVRMRITPYSDRTKQSVYDELLPDKDGFYHFARTHILVNLARYENEELISRSQAKRLMSSLDKFSEVYLDFSGITNIGQGFADEIFRVYRREHPMTVVGYTSASKDVEAVILAAIHSSTSEFPATILPVQPVSQSGSSVVVTTLSPELCPPSTRLAGPEQPLPDSSQACQG